MGLLPSGKARLRGGCSLFVHNHQLLCLLFLKNTSCLLSKKLPFREAVRKQDSSVAFFGAKTAYTGGGHGYMCHSRSRGNKHGTRDADDTRHLDEDMWRTLAQPHSSALLPPICLGIWCVSLCLSIQ